MRALSIPEAAELAGLAAVFEDLQYVLRCCEHLVTALNSPDSGPVQVATDTALVEALWTGALIGYVRCFSARGAVLTDADLAELKLDGDVTDFHNMVKKLRDHYASRHVNPREAFTIGAAQANDGSPNGIAIVSTPRPIVDDTTVRLLGRVAYALSGLVDARMAEAQNRVLGAAKDMSAVELSRLPLVHLSAEAGDSGAPEHRQWADQARSPPAASLRQLGAQARRAAHHEHEQRAHGLLVEPDGGERVAQRHVPPVLAADHPRRAEEALACSHRHARGDVGVDGQVPRHHAGQVEDGQPLLQLEALQHAEHPAVGEGERAVVVDGDVVVALQRVAGDLEHVGDRGRHEASVGVSRAASTAVPKRRSRRA